MSWGKTTICTITHTHTQTYTYTHTQTHTHAHAHTRTTCVCVCAHLTRWNHLHFGVGVVGITQKKLWAAGSPLSERWNKVRVFEESLRRTEVWACGPPLKRQWNRVWAFGPHWVDSESRWNAFFTFPRSWLWKPLCSLSYTILSGPTRLILLHPLDLNTIHCVTTP